jgi:hypothetical protein
VITFSEPQIVALMTHTYVGVHVMHYSDQMPTYAFGNVTLTAFGAVQTGIPDFYFRTTFDDRSPAAYPYDFISEHVAQIHSTGLQITFAEPVSAFAFGAALNATSAISHMNVELFGIQSQSLGVFDLLLDRTLLSLLGGTNSNSEGRFVAPSVGPISFARLTNLGDGTPNGSQYSWVIDNVTTTTAVPEPVSALLLALGLYPACRRRRSGKGNL